MISGNFKTSMVISLRTSDKPKCPVNRKKPMLKRFRYFLQEPRWWPPLSLPEGRKGWEIYWSGRGASDGGLGLEVLVLL